MEFSSVIFETVSFEENRAYYDYLDPELMQPTLFRLERSHFATDTLDSQVTLSHLIMTKNVFEGESDCQIYLSLDNLSIDDF